MINFFVHLYDIKKQKRQNRYGQPNSFLGNMKKKEKKINFVPFDYTDNCFCYYYRYLHRYLSSSSLSLSSSMSLSVLFWVLVVVLIVTIVTVVLLWWRVDVDWEGVVIPHFPHNTNQVRSFCIDFVRHKISSESNRKKFWYYKCNLLL